MSNVRLGRLSDTVLFDTSELGVEKFVALASSSVQR